MSEANLSAIETVDPIEFKSIVIESDKMGKTPVDITDMTVEIQIFEHIDKPYLTALLAFADTNDLVSTTDISGGEKVTITLQLTRPDTIEVSKTFYIDKIVSSSKSNENSEFFIFHLLEDIAYTASLSNINKSYSGNPEKIIQTISKNSLGNKEILVPSQSQQKMKVIIPNLNAIEAMSWIKNRTCTSDGYPFYLYSTIADDYLTFIDLKTMLQEGSMNPNHPYTYSKSSASTGSTISTKNRRTILQYKSSDNEDLLSLIRKGLIGAEYRFIDPTKNDNNKFTFDVQTDVIKKIKGDLNVESLVYDEVYKHDGKSFNKYQSRSISMIGSTQAYSMNSYMQSDSKEYYKSNIINKALDQLLKKNSIDITVNGTDLLGGDSNYTIGRKLTTRFLRNMAPEDTDYFFDNKKSGDFLIFSAKHNISRESYTVSLSCVKLDNGDVK
jgi:hypothetical protein